MNILEAEDIVKGLPDQVLYQYAENPPPQIPQFLAISEVQRRQDMRQRFQARQGGNEPTIKDQILQGGIASAGGPPPGGGEPPPMAPMGAAPPGAPMQQPMTGAPMPPMGMAEGGAVQGGTGVFYGGFTPSILNRPDQLQRRYGASENPGVTDFVQRDFLGNPIKFPFLKTLKAAITNPESLITPEAIVAASISGANPGLRAPPVSGGGGGGLPYGGPTSYGGSSGYGRNELMDLLSQFGDRKKPTVTVEEIPQGMAVGGIVPRRMNTGGLTPGGIVYMKNGEQVPNDPGAVMFANMMSRVPEAFKTIRGLMPPTVGISDADVAGLRPTREQYFDPQAEARRAALITQLEQTGATRRAEDIAAAERYLKEAEAPIQAAQDEARKSAIASTLMRLGAGVMAGKPEAGLASAAESVESIMSRAREQASAERRAARSEFRQAEREAARGQRAVADQAFMMQAQNLTNDENKQIQFARDQSNFAQFLFTQRLQAGRDQRAAFNDALKLSIGLSQTIDEALRNAGIEKKRDERQYTQAVISIYDKVSNRLAGTTQMIDRRETINGQRNPNFGNVIVDEDGNAILPTAEYLAEESRRETIKALSDFGITNPNTGVSIELNGETYIFPNQEAADKFKAAAGIN